MPVLGVVLLIAVTLVGGAIIAYYAIPVTQKAEGSCVEALNGISFDDIGFSCTIPDSERLSGFSVRIIDSNIEGFQVGFSNEARADTYQVLEGKSHGLLCSLGKHFGEPLEFPDVGAVRTYVVKGNFDEMFIAPILKGGKTCYSEARREVPINTECVDNDVINRFKECNVGGGPICGNGNKEPPEDCDPPTYPYKSQQCAGGEGICNENCTCVIIPECEFTGTPSWSITQAREGDIVTMTALTNGNCNGQSGIFDIYEDELGPNNIHINPGQPISGTFTTNKFTAEWTAQWIDDSLTSCVGNCNPPEYYFRATINSGSTQGNFTESPATSNSELEVSACGDDILQSQYEECDGNNLGGATCPTGWSGNVVCTPRNPSNPSTQCKIDSSGCQAPPQQCGNGELDSGEECDGNLYQIGSNTYTAPVSCELYPHTPPYHPQQNLACNPPGSPNECTINTDACGWCGDGTVNGPETCEPPNSPVSPFMCPEPPNYCDDSCGCFGA